jgi:hypothetical protein
VSSAPFLSGPLPEGGALELLRRIEDLRTTGILRFRGDAVDGEVRLVRGQLAAEQDEIDGADAVEMLLALRGGQYELWQQLPPLPVSQGDALRRRGSLSVHVPADLMNYCEGAGLTGMLRLTQGAREAAVVYDRGELVGIRVDGGADADLQRVFGWEEGAFEIEARPLAPNLDEELAPGAAPELPALEGDPTVPRVHKRRDATGVHFLSVVEVALSTVMRERESYRPPSRTGPAIPPPVHVRRLPRPAVPLVPPATKEEREPTVRIVYHSAEEPAASAAAVREVPNMAEQEQPPQPPAPSLPGLPAAPSPGSGDAPSPLVDLLWIVAVFAVGGLAIRLLALLPALE